MITLDLSKNTTLYSLLDMHRLRSAMYGTHKSVPTKICMNKEQAEYLLSTVDQSLFYPDQLEVKGENKPFFGIGSSDADSTTFWYVI